MSPEELKNRVSHGLSAEQAALVETDKRKMADAIVALHNQWAHLEDSLARLLSVAISQPPNYEENRLGTVLFFTPTSIEARIGLASAVFRVCVRRLPEPDRVAAMWQKLISKVSQRKRVRNRVAHSVVAIIQPSKDQIHVRLTASAYNVERHFEDFAKRQLPGLSANDVSQSAEALNRLGHLVDEFRGLLVYHRAGNNETFAGILGRLADRLGPQAPESEPPTPPTPARLPESSPESA